MRSKPLNCKTLLIFTMILMSYQNPIYNQVSQITDSSKSKVYSKFLPDYVKVQFAGGTGFLTAGLGYTFPVRKLDISLMYGYVPAFVSVDDLHIVTLQLAAALLRFKVNKNIEILPLNIGFNINHTFGKEYWIKLPCHYPDSYYDWSPGLASGIFWDLEIKTKLLRSGNPSSGTAFFFHTGTKGLYIISKYGNSSIPLNDILEFGAGVKFLW